MVRFYRADKKINSFAPNYDKKQKSKRRYAAFMFVPWYLLIFGLMVFFVGQIESDFADFQGYSQNMGVCVKDSSVTGSMSLSSKNFGTVDEPDKDGRIELNFASVKLLDSLPGIGPQKAELISETRAEMNGFRTVEDLLNVEGIGERTFEKLEPYLYISE